MESIVTTSNHYNHPILIEHSLHGFVYHNAAGIALMGNLFDRALQLNVTAPPTSTLLGRNYVFPWSSTLHKYLGLFVRLD